MKTFYLFCFYVFFQPRMNAQTQTRTSSVCGRPFLVHSMHRKLEVSLFMSAKKTPTSVFCFFCWLLSAGAYLAPLLPAEQNRAAPCSAPDCTDSASGKLGKVTALARGCWSSFGPIWTRNTESPCENSVAKPEQIYFSYLFRLVVPQAPRFSSWINGGDWRGLIHVEGFSWSKMS